MTEVFFLVIALVAGTPTGPDGATRVIPFETSAACEEKAKVVNATEVDKNTAIRGVCVKMTFPSILFKKGVEV